MNPTTYWLTPEQQAERIGISKRQLRDLTRKGLVRSVKLNAKTRRYNPIDVQADLSKLTTGGIN